MISLIGIKDTRRLEEKFFKKRFLASEGLEQGVPLSEQGFKERGLHNKVDPLWVT